jgi:hypothetical protein
MARTRWPPDLATPASCPGQADQTGSAGGCQKNLGPAGRSFPKTTSGVSRLAGQAGPRPPTLRPDQSKTRRQGRSTIHILPADYARLLIGESDVGTVQNIQFWHCAAHLAIARAGDNYRRCAHRAAPEA